MMAAIDIAEMFHDMLAAGASCLGSGCMESYAPENNYLIIDVGEGDDISFGGSIWDEEAYGDDVRLFHDSYTLGADVPLPTEYILSDENDLANLTVRVRIEEVTGD
ncbi:MAG: hypothetical protein AB9891_03380 [Anaerolineaceae bacterium]